MPLVEFPISPSAFTSVGAAARNGDPGRLRRFISAFAGLMSETGDESRILARGRQLLGFLVHDDDWLPETFAQPSNDGHSRYLLHCDSLERFSVVSVVRAPGQATPIHDHTVWGLAGVLRGAEISERFRRTDEGGLESWGRPVRLNPGDVEGTSPRAGDIHRVSNAFDDQISVSIQVYGANIGATPRSTFDADGSPRRLVSGYSNTVMPNLWVRSAPEVSW